MSGLENEGRSEGERRREGEGVGEERREGEEEKSKE